MKTPRNQEIEKKYSVQKRISRTHAKQKKQQIKEQPREKDRYIKHAVIYLLKWKKLRLTQKADVAAQTLKMSKKTLDDYQTQFKMCFKIGYDFQKAVQQNLRMSDLRSFKRDMISKGADVSQATKDEKRQDMEKLYILLEECFKKYDLKNELLEEQQKDYVNSVQQYEFSVTNSQPNTPALSSQSVLCINHTLHKQTSIEDQHVNFQVDNKESEEEDILSENNNFQTLIHLVECQTQNQDQEQIQILQKQNYNIQIQVSQNYEQQQKEVNQQNSNCIALQSNQDIQYNLADSQQQSIDQEIIDQQISNHIKIKQNNQYNILNNCNINNSNNNQIQSFNNILDNDEIYDSSQKSQDDNLIYEFQ